MGKKFQPVFDTGKSSLKTVMAIALKTVTVIALKPLPPDDRPTLSPHLCCVSW